MGLFAKISARLGLSVSFLLDALCICALALLAARMGRAFGFYYHADRGWWWGDAHYNLLRAFYILKGFLLYDEIPSSQFPGHQALYAAALKLLGYGSARPSSSLVDQMQTVGIYLTGVFQMTVYYTALRVAGFARVVAVAATALLIYVLWEAYGQFLPLVETLMVPVTALATCLLCRLALDDRRDLGSNLLLLGMTVSFGVVLGLTAAPAFAFWSVVACGVYLARYRETSLASTKRAQVFYWGAVWVAFMAWTWSAVGFRDLVYWTIENTSEAFRFTPIENLKVLFTTFPEGWRLASSAERHVADYPFLAVRPFGLIPIGAFCIVLWMYKPHRRFMIPVLEAVLAVGYLLMAWRLPLHLYSHKTVSALGINIGVIAMASGIVVRSPDTRWPALVTSPLRVAAVLTLSVLLLIGGARSYRYKPASDARLPEFANVCPLGVRDQNCSCMVEGYYDPQRFLQFDVQPCLGLSPDQPHAIFHSKRSLAEFAAAIERKNVGFLLAKSSAESLMFDVPLPLYERIVSTHECRPIFDGVFRVCTKP